MPGGSATTNKQLLPPFLFYHASHMCFPSTPLLIAKVGMLLGISVGLVGGVGVAAVAAFFPRLLTNDPCLLPFMGQVFAPAFICLVFTGVDFCGCALDSPVRLWGV